MGLNLYFRKLKAVLLKLVVLCGLYKLEKCYTKKNICKVVCVTE